MANFTTESQVRAKFHLTDTTLVPADWVTASITDAHTELLRYLDPAFASGTPDDALVLGETLLAGAHLYRSLAAKQAFDQKRVSAGGQRIEEADRLDALETIARIAEEQAWHFLEPYLLEHPGRLALEASDSVPVLGED